MIMNKAYIVLSKRDLLQMLAPLEHKEMSATLVIEDIQLYDELNVIQISSVDMVLNASGVSLS